MKHFYLFLSFVLISAFSFAAPKNKFTGVNGGWSFNSNWSLNRLPTSGDSIVIPSGSTLTVNNDIVLSDVHVLVSGTINIVNNNTLISLDYQSEIIVYPGGIITGSQASEKIWIGGNQVFKGNDPDITGPALATVATVGFKFGVLPVKFIGFDLARQSKDILVQWSTAEEVNAGNYEIERSFDGSNWTTIAVIHASGSAASVSSYSYTDRNVPAKTAFYRIRQTDRSGAYSFTPVRSIKIDGVANIRIASSQNRILLQFPDLASGVTFRLVSLNGQVLQESRLDQVFGQVILNTRYKGNFVVSLTNGKEVNLARQILL